MLLLSAVAESTLAEFRVFAAELGVLFQIVDDIRDVTGTEAELGKRCGSDQRHGKLTYVGRYGLRGARSMAADSHARARAALARAAPGGAPELEQIVDLIHMTGLFGGDAPAGGAFDIAYLRGVPNITLSERLVIVTDRGPTRRRSSLSVSCGWYLE